MAADRPGEIGDPPLFSALTRAPGLVVIVVDEERRILFANGAMSSVLNRPTDRIVGRTLLELLPILGRELDALVTRVVETREPALRFLWRTDSGEMEIDVAPVEGSRRAVITALVDRVGSAHVGYLRDRRAITELSSRFARITPDDADQVLGEALAVIAREYDVQRAYVRLVSEDGKAFEVSHHYDAPGMPPVAPGGDDDIRASGPIVDRYRRGETVIVESIDRLAPDDPMRAALIRAGGRAVCGVPIVDGDRLLGRLAFLTTADREWPESATSRIRLFGEMFGSAVARVRANAALRERLRFEQSLATMFARLVDAQAADLDAELGGALLQMAEMLRMDRAIIALLDEARERSIVTHEWSVPGLATFESATSGLPVTPFGWPLEEVHRGHTVNVTREEVPESAINAKTVLDRAGVRAMAMIPLSVNGDIIGHIVFQSVTRTARIPQDLVARLHLVGGVIASTLARSRADQSLRESEARFTQVIESALDGVVLLDAAGIVIEWNPQAERLFGRERHEVVGRPFVDVALDPKDHARFVDRDAGEARLELTGIHREGRAFPIELSIAPMKRGAQTIAAMFVRDITDRRRAEQERQRAFDEVNRQKSNAERERDYLREELGADGEGILGRSPALRRAIEGLDAVASTNAAVLIHGESGVGKELFARALHSRSKRAAGALVKVNCASIPESLFESEFFGHVRGSFTGAHKDRVGRFELADGGTLFLDEVGEIPLDMQAKLLRVLQEGEFERVGDDRTRKVDVRLVAATNRDLAAEVQAGRFRRDLYYRLSVFPIAVPPLRERPEDVVPLAQHFLTTMARSAGRVGLELTQAHKTALLDYDWPGNIRELQHVIERAVIVSPTPPLRLELAASASASSSTAQSAPRMRAAEGAILTDEELRKLERDNVVAALEKAGGRISGDGGAAEILKVNPSTLRDRMKALGIARRA
jgi:PAS domain S-box-containing protein